jgi:hypothetical protein
VRLRVDQLGHRAHLHDAPRLHDGDALSEERRFGHVVRDEDDALGEAIHDREQVVLQARAHHRVERGHGLVEEKHVGVEHQGAHQPDALALAAARLQRIARKEARLDVNELRELANARVDSGRAPPAPSREERDVAHVRQMRKQAAVLNDVPDAEAQAVRARRRQHGPANHDRSGVGDDDANDGSEQRRLPAAARPHQGEALRGSDLEARGRENDGAVVALRDARDRDHEIG